MRALFAKNGGYLDFFESCSYGNLLVETLRVGRFGALGAHELRMQRSRTA